MNLFLDIARGIGLASAAGIRPFLPTLLAGALARGDLGIDFSGTDFSFLESPIFLFALVVLLAVMTFIQRRYGADAVEQGALGATFAGLGIGLGALMFAGSLADGGFEWWPGLIGGIACALLAQAASRSLFGRTRARLDEEARQALPLYAEISALVLAGLSILIPPISILALIAFVWLLLGGRRREGKKYAGLRVLR